MQKSLPGDVTPRRQPRCIEARLVLTKRRNVRSVFVVVWASLTYGLHCLLPSSKNAYTPDGWARFGCESMWSYAMTEERAKHVRALQMAAVAALLAATVLAQTPNGPVFLHVAQKLAHPVVFGICSLLILSLRHRLPLHDMSLRITEYASAFAITVGAGVMSEIAQGFTHRDPSIIDVLRDSLGAATALAGHCFVSGTGASGPRRGRGVRMGAGVVCALGFVAASAPMVWCLAAYANRDLHAPVLWQPRSALDMYFADARGCELRDYGALATPDNTPPSLCVALPSSEGSAGFVLREPYPDWRGRSTLMIDLSNPTSQALQLTVRVNDRSHNQEEQDRYNRSFVVAAQMRCVIAIPVAEIAAAPRGRRMDLEHIAHMAVFRSGRSGDARLVLRRIWLQ